ncbi:hypothetical protein R3P38DRAFT_3292020 [Favolaschia claudopus]|uniref:Uncharacterized protein n=1 Tax=Favolaschia claudopus TaxID=2862362 RepID=A0AAV9ZL91_9AGAR
MSRFSVGRVVSWLYDARFCAYSSVKVSAGGAARTCFAPSFVAEHRADVDGRLLAYPLLLLLHFFLSFFDGDLSASGPSLVFLDTHTSSSHSTLPSSLYSRSFLSLNSSHLASFLFLFLVVFSPCFIPTLLVFHLTACSPAPPQTTLPSRASCASSRRSSSSTSARQQQNEESDDAEASGHDDPLTDVEVQAVLRGSGPGAQSKKNAKKRGAAKAARPAQEEAQKAALEAERMKDVDATQLELLSDKAVEMGNNDDRIHDLLKRIALLTKRIEEIDATKQF